MPVLGRGVVCSVLAVRLVIPFYLLAHSLKPACSSSVRTSAVSVSASGPQRTLSARRIGGALAAAATVAVAPASWQR